MTAEERKPAELWPPRTYLLAELAARGWTLEELVRRMTQTEERVAWACLHQVLEVRPINEMPTTAHKLALALGGSAQHWTNLDNAFWTALHSGSYHLTKDR